MDNRVANVLFDELQRQHTAYKIAKKLGKKINPQYMKDINVIKRELNRNGYIIRYSHKLERYVCAATPGWNYGDARKEKVDYFNAKYGDEEQV